MGNVPVTLALINPDVAFWVEAVAFIAFIAVIVYLKIKYAMSGKDDAQNTGKSEKVVISLVGEKGGGKGTFFELLKKYPAPGTGVGLHRFSDPLSEGLAILGLPKNRNNQQLLPQLLNDPLKQNCTPPNWLGNSAGFASTLNYAKLDALLKNFAIPASPANIDLAERLISDPTRPDRGTWEGLDAENTEMVLANAVRKRALENPNQIVVLDGARWLVDEQMLRDLNCNVTSIIVYVTAPADVRYERLKARTERVGESGMSREQFDREEKAHTEIFIPQIGKRADHVIVNDGTLEKYDDEVWFFYCMFIDKNIRQYKPGKAGRG